VVNVFCFGKAEKLLNVRDLTKYREIKICVPSLAETLCEPNIRARAPDGRVARLVSLFW
jgi:hypothetical protein